MSYLDAPTLSAGYPYALPLQSRPRKPFRPVRAIVRGLIAWQARTAERAALREMPLHLLRDNGIDAGVARREADKPVWRA